ncbi:hypothetical protein GUJ93_ZPchr0001g31621 [Zizania palustris]|uniref:Calmodulin-binding domain-containing protein n=1 Tax=Zizania palustris TaxID=103762 RepID=A0A8J5SAU7_ZIZPA|nr:hypothetical protein GUJ93_ZPchr0001g31621 [Zizania palustris]KAG8053947.1 hypothetical protein GUJ93_ZPchr0001g31621 [Zizania palustris]
MVQRKQVRKKPKDSVAVICKDGLPTDHLRGGGDTGSRGDGAMVRSALPNYMRATSSSDARAVRAVGGEAAPAAPPRKREAVRANVVFTKTPRASRATCSSTMKGFGLAGAVHVCPYSYCSFKGHVHASSVPLRSVVASRRRLINKQQSMKLEGVSPLRKNNNGGGGGNTFFVKIFAGTAASAIPPTVGSDASCSDLSTEDMDATARRVEYAMFDHRSCGDDNEYKAKDSDGSVDGSCGSSDVISGGSVELSGTKSRGCKQVTGEEKGIYMDQEAEDFGACKSDISEELYARYEDGGADASNESSIDDISCAFGGMNFKEVCSDPTDAASIQRKKWNKRTSEQGEQIRPFNPRAPNFLPVEPDPETEKVDLRHQMMGDRKNAEEWMVDYALRRAVNKLARVQKRKVEMLVQAFETVLPPGANEKKSLQSCS